MPRTATPGRRSDVFKRSQNKDLCGDPNSNLFPLKWTEEGSWLDPQTEKLLGTPKGRTLQNPKGVNPKTWRQNTETQWLVSNEHPYFTHGHEPHRLAIPPAPETKILTLKILLYWVYPKKTPYSYLPNKSVFLTSIAEDLCSGLSSPGSSSPECYVCQAWLPWKPPWGALWSTDLTPIRTWTGWGCGMLIGRGCGMCPKILISPDSHLWDSALGPSIYWHCHP